MGKILDQIVDVETARKLQKLKYREAVEYWWYNFQTVNDYGREKNFSLLPIRPSGLDEEVRYNVTPAPKVDNMCRWLRTKGISVEACFQAIRTREALWSMRIVDYGPLFKSLELDEKTDYDFESYEAALKEGVKRVVRQLYERKEMNDETVADEFD
jgi:hypothetical protein